MNDCVLTYETPSGHLRPREKAEQKGVTSLSDTELVQLLIRSGGPGQPVEELAVKALRVLDLKGPQVLFTELEEVPGIGPARAASLAAALEMGRRVFQVKNGRVLKPENLWPQLIHYAQRPQERFLVICLSGAHEILKIQVVTIGLVNRTLIHPREIFSVAIAERATSVILAHNHPSGCLEPSWEDREVTQRLKKAGELLGIPVLDHLIFSTVGFYSFVNAGIF